MNKKLVDQLLPAAVDTLSTCGIAKGGKIDKNFRGQISSFGAAVSYGSLLAAAAFFNQQAGAKNDRSLLMEAINKLLKDKVGGYTVGKTLFDTIRSTPADRQRKLKEDVLSCAVALKLGMNLYTLTDSDQNQGAGE